MTEIARFVSTLRSGQPIETAPDGSSVEPLVRSDTGSMAHFTLNARDISVAVSHKTVDELWFFLSGEGEMWLRQGELEEIIPLLPDVSISIPASTHFQFRNTTDEPLTAVGVTIPPWPGDDEAETVDGPWNPSV